MWHINKKAIFIIDCIRYYDNYDDNYNINGNAEPSRPENYKIWDPNTKKWMNVQYVVNDPEYPEISQYQEVNTR